MYVLLLLRRSFHNHAGLLPLMRSRFSWEGEDAPDTLLLQQQQQQQQLLPRNVDRRLLFYRATAEAAEAAAATEGTNRVFCLAASD